MTLPRSLDLASALSDEQITALFVKADELFMREEYALAIPAYREALNAFPDDANAWINLGIALEAGRER